VRADTPHPSEEWNPGEATEPRQAASIVVLRDTDDGPEVLLVQRNPEQRFMGGAWVFPGGAVHSEDADHAAAAVRELEEEAGVRLPAGLLLELAHGSECVDVRWLRPAVALQEHQRGELMLVFPTIKHLEALAGMGSIEQIFDKAGAREVVPVQPRVVVRDGAAEVLLPGDPGYDQA